MATPLCIAHRGASGTRPENTRAAFRRAVEVGADMIEADVRLTADDQPLTIHDATLDRTTNGTGRGRDHDLADLRQLDAGSWFAPECVNERLPALEELVEIAIGRAALLLELKDDGVEAATVAAIRRHGDPRSCICSFDDHRLELVRELEAGLPTALIVGIDPLSEHEIERLVARSVG